MHMHVVSTPTFPSCTRERTPSSGEHVYAPGRTPSSVNIRHMRAPERTLERPQTVLHVNPREETLNWRARAGDPICTREDTPTANIYIYAPKRTPSWRTYAVCEHKSTRSSKLRLGCGGLFTSVHYNIQSKYICT